MKKFACLLGIFIIGAANILFAAEGEKLQISVIAKDSRTAIQEAEEASLQQAISKFFTFTEAMQYGAEIKSQILDHKEQFATEADIIQQERKDTGNEYTVSVTVDLAALQTALENIKNGETAEPAQAMPITPTETSAEVDPALPSADATAEYDALNTLQALNGAIISIGKITSTRDRVIMTQEYEAILNNLNFGVIRDDFELIELNKKIMDTVTESLIDEQARARADQIYERKKDKALMAAFRDRMPIGGSLASFLGSVVLGGVSGYLDYEVSLSEYQTELDEKDWVLDDKKARELNELSKQLLDTSWRLMQRYQFPGEQRLTANTIDEFTSSIRVADRKLALRRLNRLEAALIQYPPYWFYRGFFKHLEGQKAEALADFKKFEEVWHPIYLQDPIYAEAAKYLLEDAVTRKDQAAQKKYAEIILAHSGKDGWLNIAYVGVVYDEMGDKDMARECFQRNLDSHTGVAVNQLALDNLREGKAAAAGIEEFAGLMRLYTESDDIEAMQKLADNGNEDATLELVRRYLTGNDVSEDHRKAFEIVKPLADKGNPLAQARLGWLYLYGDMGDELHNSDKGLRLIKSSASQGQRYGQYLLGLVYKDGTNDVTSDATEAAKWFGLSAEQGHINATAEMAFMYYNGSGGINQDYAKAFNLAQQAAEQGDFDAQRLLGLCYENGRGVNKDAAEALKWYKKAAENGDVTAMRFIGISYWFGDIVPEDSYEAVIWFTQAAEQGDSISKAYLGDAYYYGEGIGQNYVEAFQLHQQAAEQGNANAQYMLGLHYDLGSGVSINYPEAVKWYSLAANQGDARAQRNLGVLYYHGDGVSKNLRQAAEWIQKAAEQDDAKAQYYLGILYEEGAGVRKDEDEAETWYERARKNGYDVPEEPGMIDKAIDFFFG